MKFLKKNLVDYSQDQRQYIQTIFSEFKECGPNFMSFITSQKENTFYISNSLKWEKIYSEENIIEKDAFNYLDESSTYRKWVCWNNLPKVNDPHGSIERRIKECQTVKSASFIIPAYDALHTFNFAFDHDLDIENFIWENDLLIENYALGMAKILSQSRS